MKYLIVGLGNPGAKYENTRHNIGFKVVEKLAEKFDVKFSLDKTAEKAEFKHKGRTFILIKPTTFMNLSGKAVNYWMQKEKLNNENILVVVDELALPFGTIRMKGKGSDGGHNGLKDIQQIIGSKYPRLRFGIGNEFHKGMQVSYVLGEWDSEELKSLDERIEMAAEAVLSFGTIGLAHTMNQFNGK